MIQTLRSRIHFYFDDIQSLGGRLVDLVVVSLIFLVSVIFVIKTFSIPDPLRQQLDHVENFIVGLFVLEYLLRIWASPNRLREIFQLYSLVDLIAIIPLFFAGESYQVLRVFRALRVLRLLRYLRGQYFFSWKLRYTHIIIIRIIFIIFAIIFVSSGMIFYAEHNLPGTGIHNFGDAVYFSTVTLTTVGFGDITPVSGYGRLITLMIIFSGIIFIPWEIKELIQQFSATDNKPIIVPCTQCGLETHEVDALYCRHCGTALSEINPGSVPSTGDSEFHSRETSGND